MKDYEFEDYEGDSICINAVNNRALGWCIYVYNTEAADKAEIIEVSGIKVVCAKEVGVALPLNEARKVRDYLTAAIEFCETKKAASGK